MPSSMCFMLSTLNICTQSASGMVPFADSALKWAQLCACSSDRKRSICPQASAQCCDRVAQGVLVWPTMPGGLAERISPSRCSITMVSLQSRQGVSMWMVLPGKSQQTASDSNPHCAYHFCSPSMVILWGVGMLEKGGNEAIQSVSGCSHTGKSVAVRS